MHHPVALRMSIFAHRVPLLEYKFSARSTAWILSQFFNIVRIFDWLSYNSGVCRIKINADLTCMYLVESLLEISIISLLGSYFGRYLVHSVSDWLRIKFSEKAGPTSWYEKRNDRSLRNLAIRDSTTYCIHLTSIFLLYRSYVRNVPRVFVTTRRVSLYARKEGQHYRFNIILLYSLVLCIYSLNASGGGIEQWCEASDREHITLAYFFHRRKKTT